MKDRANPLLPDPDGAGHSGVVAALTSPDLDALFWRAEHQAVESAWHGHVPFAHWIVRASAPRVLVELGPDTGVSYAAFCQAVVKAELTTRCFALCPGRRDEHADHGGSPGPGGSDTVHRARYGGFSRLLRGTPAEALASFQDGSIDLLHIDGGRSGAEARRCFDGWYPKLSRHAVVLLHGTNIRDDGAGVWRLWAELRERYPSFEFLHGNGLGVLAPGEAVPAPVLALCRTTDPQQVRRIRERFALLGEGGQAEALLDLRSADLERLQATLAAQRKTAEATQQTLSQQVARLRTKLRTAEYRVAQLDAEVRHLADHAAQVRDALQRTENMRRTSQTALEQLWDQLQALHRSASWRISAPLRRMSSLLRGRPQHEPPRKPNLLEHGSRTMPGSAAAAAWSPAYQNGARRRRVLFVSGEPKTPGHIYRVTRHAEAARAAGWAAQATSLAELSEAAVFSTDVLVLWRCTWSPEVDFVFYLAEYAGITVLFDVDDLMFKPELARTEIIDGIRTQDFDPAMVADFYRQVQRVLMRSDACICTTRELACHARDFDRTTFILPNGFDAATLAASRLAVRRRRQQADDGLVRIGYASGTRTHQRDFRQAVAGLARVLQDRPACRLVLFREPDRALLDVAEFPELAAAAGQIEWRDKVPLDRLPEEMARFDVNLAPLEVGNPFCEAKSELKYFEAALVDVPTVASPTGPMRRAIRDGETGLLATTPEDWYAALLRLVDDPALRQRMARSAHRDVLWRYGPDRKQDLMLSLLQQVDGGQHGARAFELEILRESRPAARFDIPRSEVVFIADRMQPAEVTVIVPLYQLCPLYRGNPRLRYGTRLCNCST